MNLPSTRTIPAAEFLDLLTRPREPGEAFERALVAPADEQWTVEGDIDFRARNVDSPLHLERLVFTGDVDFAETQFSGSVRIEHCTFEHALCLRDASVKGRLSLEASSFTDADIFMLDFERLHVDGHVDLSLVKAETGINLRSLDTRSDVILSGVEILTSREVSVALEGADIRGSVFVRTFDDQHPHFKGAVELIAKIGGQVDFSEVHVEVVGNATAIDMEKADVGGAVIFGDDTHVQGAIDLRGKIGGQIAFSKVRVEVAEYATAINMDSADVEGSVFFRNDIHVQGAIDLRAKIGGQVAFSEARIEVAEYATAIKMENAHVGNSVFFRNDIHVQGAIDLRAKIGGQVAFSDARVQVVKDATAIKMSSAEVEGSVFFRDDTHVQGAVDLRAKIGRNVEFSNVRVQVAENAIAIIMDSADVGGSVFFRDDTRVQGIIDLRARIGGQVDFRKAHVEAAENAIAVKMHGAVVQRQLIFVNGTRIQGAIDLRAKIEGQVFFTNMTCRVAPGEAALWLYSAEIGGKVFFDQGTFIQGHVHLLQAKLRNGLTTKHFPRQAPAALPSLGETTKNWTILGDLDLSYAEIGGPVWLDGLSLQGQLQARHLTVQGDFDLCGSLVGPCPNPAFTARNLESFQQTKELDSISEITKVKEVCGVWQAGEIDRAPVSQENGAYPLDFELAEIQGRFWVKGSRILGTLRLEDAEVAGEANLARSEIHGSLLLRSAVVKGRIFADEMAADSDADTFYPQVTGNVDLSFSDVQQVDMKLNADAGNCFLPQEINFTSAKVGTLRLHGTVRPIECVSDGEYRYRPQIITEGLDFQSLEVDKLAIPLGKRKASKRDQVRATVFRLLFVLAFLFALFFGAPVTIVLLLLYVVLMEYLQSRFHKGREPKPKLDLLEYSYPFSRGFYLDMEQWLRSSGDEEAANEAFLLRRKRETSPPKKPAENWQASSWGMQVWHSFVDLASGYGVRWQRLVHLYVLLWFLSTGVFLARNSVERPLSFEQGRMDLGRHTANVAPEEATDNPWPDDGGIPTREEWSERRAFFMAMRVQIPLLGMIAENDWEPSSRGILVGYWPHTGKPMELWLTYEEFASSMMVANFIILPLIIAGATGYLKK